MQEFATIPGLSVGEDRITWPGGEFLFADIASIVMPRSLKSMVPFRLLNPYALLLHALLVNEGGIVLHGVDGREIRFALKSGLNYPGQGHRIADLRALKAVLMKRTFSVRAERYERSLAERGFFEHDGYAFYRDGSVHQGGLRLFGLRDPGFAAIYGGHELALMPDKSAAAYFLSKLHTVNLLNNGDCFLYLLNIHFGLKFGG